MTIQELTTLSSKLLSKYHLQSSIENAPPWTREDLMKGFVVNAGELMRLTMVKEGKRTSADEDVDAKLGHELADCLWSVLLLAKPMKSTSNPSSLKW